ncbi:MAG TPA: YihY/virulence factor BrkB family protein [Longimicrobiales bacterium]|nr:YihY/virulence factor BrkB family protein [Longimicrobiales bacterium]
MKVYDLTRRIVSGAMADNITGEAAKAAYYFFLSLFPMILAGFALTGFLGGTSAFDTIMGWLQGVLPGVATEYLEEFVREITDERRPEALSLGILLAVWSASNFFAALGDGLDAMFNVRENATWWKKRLKAIGLMVVGGALLWGGAIAIVAGPQLASALGLGSYAHWLAWPIVLVLLVALLWTVYYVMPAHDQRNIRGELLVGAIAGTIVWMLATLLFRIYVSNIANFGRTYGFIGGIIVLLLWLYITALSILLGGEVADVLSAERDTAA